MAEELICIAHRGASGHYPENTLLAFDRALQAGAGWLELDVQLADGELVVIHDERLERTTNGRGLVGRQPLAYLRYLDAGRGERIPLLEEVLEQVAGRATLNIELKGPGTAAPTASLIDSWVGRGRLNRQDILVSSMSKEELVCAKQLLPKVRLAPVYSRLPADPWQLAEELGAWSIHLARRLVNPGLVAEAHRRGFRVLVFTVNEERELKRMRQLGVDGLFTDYPERILIS